jgi:Ni/Co efflux regulator RcnB
MTSSSTHRSSLVATAMVMTLAVSGLCAGSAIAANQRDSQDQVQAHAGWGQDNQGANHQWRRGQRIGYNDWSGAQTVDYRAHHLRAPPRGYEWRESNGQYVMAAVAGGLIASIIMSNGR